MILSICEKFTENDDAWKNYITWIRLQHLNEVRTIDRNLNMPLVEYRYIPSVEAVLEKLHELPAYNADGTYIRLAVNCAEEKIPDLAGLSARLLGYDLADNTEVSSILNCGPWEGDLLPFVTRLNSYGLLTYDDALQVQELLPAAWHDDPHSVVDIWAVFELSD